MSCHEAVLGESESSRSGKEQDSLRAMISDSSESMPVSSAVRADSSKRLVLDSRATASVLRATSSVESLRNLFTPYSSCLLPNTYRIDIVAHHHEKSRPTFKQLPIRATSKNEQTKTVLSQVPVAPTRCRVSDKMLQKDSSNNYYRFTDVRTIQFDSTALPECHMSYYRIIE